MTFGQIFFLKTVPIVITDKKKPLLKLPDSSHSSRFKSTCARLEGHSEVIKQLDLTRLKSTSVSRLGGAKSEVAAALYTGAGTQEMIYFIHRSRRYCIYLVFMHVFLILFTHPPISPAILVLLAWDCACSICTVVPQVQDPRNDLFYS